MPRAKIDSPATVFVYPNTQVLEGMTECNANSRAIQGQ